MIVESTRSTGWRAEGTLWGSHDLRDWRPYVVAGQIFIFLFMIVEFGAMPVPAILSVAIAMVGLGVAVIAPPGKVMRIPLSAPILLYLTWYVMSKAWAYDQVWWMRIARREVPMTVAMIVVAAVLPLPAIARAIVASFYAVVAVTIASLIISPGTTARHIYPDSSQPPLPGWHGLFDHKTGMSLFLLVGLSTVLTFEPSKLRRSAAYGDGRRPDRRVAVVHRALSARVRARIPSLAEELPGIQGPARLGVRARVDRHRRDRSVPDVGALAGPPRGPREGPHVLGADGDLVGVARRNP